MIPVCSSIDMVEVSGERLILSLYVSPSGSFENWSSGHICLIFFLLLTDAGLYVNVSGLEVMLNVTAFSYIPAPASVVNLRFNTFTRKNFSFIFIVDCDFSGIGNSKVFLSFFLNDFILKLMCTCVPSSVFLPEHWQNSL